MRYAKIGALAGAVVLVAAACSSAASSGCSAARAAAPQRSAAASKGTLKIGIVLPLSGGAAADGQPTLKGAQLAVEQANAAGGIGGYMLEVLPLDHSVNGKYNEQQGAQDMQTLVGDAAVIGVVGPYNSTVAKVQIPISNDAGLLQCSPANTNESLTKPESGALDYRKNFPERINYIRVAATDDIQGPAMATYAFDKLEPEEPADRRRRDHLRQGPRRQLPEEVGSARRHGRRARRRRPGHDRLQRDHHVRQGPRTRTASSTAASSPPAPACSSSRCASRA